MEEASGVSTMVQLSRFISNKERVGVIAKKYLEYVLSAKTMNARSYSPPPSHLCDP